MTIQTIVLATDLTDSAAQAADYALALATRLHARLVLVHAYEHSPDVSSDFVYTPLRLERIRERLVRTCRGSVEVSVVARQGDPRTCIEAVVAEERADLLVMALADTRPYTARFLGSMPTEMIPQTAVSMLILPPGSQYKPLETMVLAVDLSEPIDAVTLGKAKAVAQQLGVALDIICMDDHPDAPRREAARHLRELFVGLPHTFSFWPGNDLTTTLDDYFTTHPADLIMMLPRHHNRLTIWLMESITQQVARQAFVPVLAVV